MHTWREINEMLAQPLDISHVEVRQQGGDNVPYLPGEYVIQRLNEIFDFDGWSSDVLAFEMKDLGTRPGKNGAPDSTIRLYMARYSLTLMGLLDDGRVHAITKSDTGKNTAVSNSTQEHEMAASGTFTDALKRCARQLGNQFGLSLYDKDSEDFKAVTRGGNQRRSEPAARAAKKEAAPPPPQEDMMVKALAYVVPPVLGTTKVPAAGKSLGELVQSPANFGMLFWIAGLRDSQGGIPALTTTVPDEVKVQKAARYVIANTPALAALLNEMERALVKS